MYVAVLTSTAEVKANTINARYVKEQQTLTSTQRHSKQAAQPGQHGKAGNTRKAPAKVNCGLRIMGEV